MIDPFMMAMMIGFVWLFAPMPALCLTLFISLLLCLLFWQAVSGACGFISSLF